MIAVSGTSGDRRCTRTTRFIAVHPERTRDVDGATSGDVLVADLRDVGFDVVHREAARTAFDLVDAGVAIVVEAVAKFRASQSKVRGSATRRPAHGVALVRTGRAANTLRSGRGVVAGARLPVVRNVLVDKPVAIVVERRARVADFVVCGTTTRTNARGERTLPRAVHTSDGDLRGAFRTHVAAAHAANLACRRSSDHLVDRAVAVVVEVVARFRRAAEVTGVFARAVVIEVVVAGLATLECAHAHDA